MNLMSSIALASVHERDSSTESANNVLAYFPVDMPVTYDADGAVASRYGDISWDLSAMSTDGTSARTLHFYAPDIASATVLGLRLREQQKALMWLHMDAGKLRAPLTLQHGNLALNAWCDKAGQQGLDLYTLLTNPELMTQGAQGMNLNYVELTGALVRTLWRHRHQLGAPADIQLQALRDVLSQEARRRPDSQQTPLIPSRVYCAILAAMVERMDLIEREVDLLLGPQPLGRAVSPEAHQGCAGAVRFDGRLAEHQVALMLVVAAFTGMRNGEVSILPAEGVLGEFEHMGSTHYELQGSTHKLNKGVKHSTSWITSHQGARAVRLAQRIARAILQQNGEPPKVGQTALLFPSIGNPYRRIAMTTKDRCLSELREAVCPVVEQSDIEELDRLELARGWARNDIEVGKRWPLAFHQLRRSLTVYAHRSGMVSLPALKAQLQHITQEMTAYYADGFSRAVNLVFDKQHFSHEWKAAKAESSYFAYALGVLFSDEDLLGQGAQRMANTVESRSRQDTLRLFEENKLAYRETPLGGCVSTESCKTDPLEPIPYNCLETNCVNLVVFGKRLEHVLRFQENAVATLKKHDPDSVEHRLEALHLDVLLKARKRLNLGGK